MKKMKKKKTTKIIKEKKKDYKKKKIYTGFVELLKFGKAKVHADQFNTPVFIPKIYSNGANDGDEVEFILIDSPKMAAVEGQITKVIKRNSSEFVGVVNYTHGNYYVELDNRLKIKIKKKHLKRFDDADTGSIVVVKVEEWKEPLRGVVIEHLGQKSDPHVSMLTIARRHGFNPDFPEGVLAEIDGISQSFIDNYADGRTNLRNELIFTVDPTDAKDFDDAISITKNEDNTYDLGVHIADVSAFVKEGSATDKDALQRGFSLYLPSSVIPMLPTTLSNRLCSLNPEIDRLAFSCFMKIDFEGNILKYSFKESVINSKMRFDYKTYQECLDNLIDGKELSDEYKPFKDAILWSKELKDILLKKRVSEGSIGFELPEIKIELDEKGFAKNIFTYVLREANNIIEEFMLVANICAAKYLKSKENTLPGIYRIHERPNDVRMNEYILDIEEIGVDLGKLPNDLTNHKFIQDLLKKIKNLPNGDVLIYQFLRTMMKAKYSTENIGHYGLAFDMYTHFTSPIRRYADLMVHRLIKKHMKYEPIRKDLDNEKAMDRKAKFVSMREVKSIKAEYEAKDMKVAEFMVDKVGKSYTGIITTVTQNGAYVRLNEIPIEGMLHNRNQKDYYEFDEKKRILKGKRTGREFKTGNEVSIKVLASDTELLTIDFVLDEDKNDKKRGKDKK